jgi:hypothetical protein
MSRNRCILLLMTERSMRRDITDLELARLEPYTFEPSRSFFAGLVRDRELTRVIAYGHSFKAL